MDNADDPSSEPIGSSLCHVCQGFGDLKSPRGVIVETAEEQREHGRYVYVYMHQPNVEDLRTSAEAGCGMCNVLHAGLRTRKKTTVEGLDTASLVAGGGANTRQKSVSRITLSEDDTSVATHLAELTKTANQLEAWDTFGIERIAIRCYCDEKTGPRASTDDPLDPKLEHRPSRDLLSETHIGLLNRWRASCKEEHMSCRTSACALPSRILELTDSNDETRGVRLVETSGNMQGAYACLSYCWGDSKAQIGQTTRANLLSQLRGIAFKELPDTVVDAIRLCYKLGFRFLWVDRLCIVQDDNSDWSTEASKMCDIYSRSALTISVPLCSESSQSFLAARSKGFREQAQFCIMEYTDEGSESYKDVGSRSKSTFSLTPRHLERFNGPWFLERRWVHFCPKPNYKENRWLDRGWTFQEWMLSPRVLHIDSMTMWDCFNGYANELTRRYMGEPPLLRDTEHLGTRISWEGIVAEYSKRKVSFGKDRLPALAGLATRYRQATGYTYLAGLWLEDMPGSLLWGNFGSGPGYYPKNQRLANQNAPSWSWACSDGPVREDTASDFSPIASIVSFYCRYNPPDSISAVEEAWIDVEGRLSIVTEQQDVVDDFERNIFYAGKTIINDGNEWWISYPDNGEGYPDDAIVQDNVYLFIVGFVKWPEVWEYKALVLQRRGLDNGRTCFERLGVARLLRSRLGETSAPDIEYFWEPKVVRLV